MTLGRGVPRRLTALPQDEFSPSWSPSGRRIAYRVNPGRSLAFNSHRDGQFEIYRTALDGSRQRNLTHNPAKDQWPSWSPDGSRVAFMSERAGSEDVFVMRADGSGVRNLTRTGSLSESHPTWMPDGRLSFSRHGETGPVELWSMGAEGSDARRLRTSAQPVFVFSWKPNR